MTLMAVHITQMLYGFPSEFLFKFCFCIFVGKASLIMTYHLHQIDTVSYLSLASVKLNPCKIRTGTLAGSHRSRQESCRDPSKILAARIFLPGEISAGIPARFSPGNEIPGGQTLAGILPRISPRFSPRSKSSAAKILARCCCESHQDSRREAVILAAKISPESYCESRQGSHRGANSWWQKSQRDLAGNLAKIGNGKRDSW